MPTVPRAAGAVSSKWSWGVALCEVQRRRCHADGHDAQQVVAESTHPFRDGLLEQGALTLSSSARRRLESGRAGLDGADRVHPATVQF